MTSVPRCDNCLHDEGEHTPYCRFRSANESRDSTCSCMVFEPEGRDTIPDRDCPHNSVIIVRRREGRFDRCLDCQRVRFPWAAQQGIGGHPAWVQQAGD